MNISDLIDTINNAIDGNKKPATILPPLLLKCTSLMRSGLSAYRTTAKIIRDCKKAGIPTGPNPDGTPNLINAYSYIVVKEIFSAIKNDATVQVAVPASSLLVEVNGGNAGGPVVCTGTNLLDSIANGIMQ